jgi:hypothetical protein
VRWPGTLVPEGFELFLLHRTCSDRADEGKQHARLRVLPDTPRSKNAQQARQEAPLPAIRRMAQNGPLNVNIVVPSLYPGQN